MNKRKATRLSNYDYSQIGLYFITICTKNKKCYFGQIVNDRMILNIAGKIRLPVNKCGALTKEVVQRLT